MAERCNKEMVNPPLYSEQARERFEAEVGKAREFMLPLISRDNPLQVHQLAGERFNSDEKVYRLLRSCVPEEMFLADAERWVIDALLGCSERDYWYAFEKKWD
jgi:hypothetical protein